MRPTIQDRRRYACHALIGMFGSLMWAASCLSRGDSMTAIYGAHINGAGLALFAAGIITAEERDRLSEMVKACASYTGPAPQ